MFARGTPGRRSGKLHPCGSSICNRPDRHLPLIPLFVRWKAAQNFATKEGLDPGPLSQLAFTLELNAGRCETAYRNALTASLQAETDSSLSPWRMDKHDRVY